MIPWYVCFLLVSISAMGFYALGAVLTNKKLRQELKNERDIVLQHLNILRSIINDKIAADTSGQCKTIKTYVDAFIWLISLKGKK